MNLRDAKRMVYEQELNYEREKNAKPDDYKYYNLKNFTTNPERIYKIIISKPSPIFDNSDGNFSALVEYLDSSFLIVAVFESSFT